MSLEVKGKVVDITVDAARVWLRDAPGCVVVLVDAPASEVSDEAIAEAKAAVDAIGSAGITVTVRRAEAEPLRAFGVALASVFALDNPANGRKRVDAAIAGFGFGQASPEALALRSLSEGGRGAPAWISNAAIGEAMRAVRDYNVAVADWRRRACTTMRRVPNDVHARLVWGIVEESFWGVRIKWSLDVYRRAMGWA